MPPPLIQRKIAMVYKLFIVVGVILAFINFRLVKERAQYMYAESTRKVYSSPAVCAAMNDQNDRIVNFTTVQNHSKAKKQVMQVAHCGECGECSTSNDIKIMKETKDTLTKTVTICALYSLFFGDKATEACLEKRIGFTPACSLCWSDNVRCTRENCRFTCLKYFIMRESNNRGGVELNSCLECDEKLCGPAFIQCAGANRRRLGIESDIKRDVTLEQCQLVDNETME
mmetsp:Transcript_14276/g.18029  ORF Transcript_14276/g.18029 Transcript_14276/m.18029 type:complete len:228 (-) Transcript_14276:1324-2007(-)